MFERKRKVNLNINLIPLINVIFLLLIFFMVAGTVENIDILDIAVPKSEKSEEQAKVQTTLYLGKEGKLAINNDLIEDSDIKTIISTILIEAPDQPISIKADSSVDVERLIWVMGIIEELGGQNIYLITEKENAKSGDS